MVTTKQLAALNILRIARGVTYDGPCDEEEIDRFLHRWNWCVSSNSDTDQNRYESDGSGD